MRAGPATAALLLALAACHRHEAAGVTLDADEDARNATSAKIDADLAAADAAARAPMPRLAPHPAASDDDRQPTRDEPASPTEDADTGNDTDQ